MDRGNNTARAEFSCGANIEIRVENGIVSVMLVTLPQNYRSLTRGLMGNYNGDTTDDLVPRGSQAGIPVESSNEEIFTFGNTCESIILCTVHGYRTLQHIQYNEYHYKNAGFHSVASKLPYVQHKPPPPLMVSKCLALYCSLLWISSNFRTNGKAALDIAAI